MTALPAFLLWSISLLLPVRWASAFGSLVVGLIGPYHRKHTRIVRNLRSAFPDLDENELLKITRDTWRNAGAVLGELPHSRRIAQQRVVLEIAPATRKLIDNGTPFLVISAHLANWEIITFTLAETVGPTTFVYTPDRNPYIASLVQRFRTHQDCEYVSKESAARTMLQAGNRDRSIATMGDTRVDGGVLLPLFNVDAPTTTVPVRVAQRIGYPIVPIRTQRLPRARFRVEFCTPIYDGTQKGTDDPADVMIRFNQLLEGWIRERPGEWWCTKRRWPIPPKHTQG